MRRAFSRRTTLLLFIAAAILLIFAVKSNLYFFTQRVPGSFEYIRKGEYFIDKGRYREAIKYFEKAYESSPESETIKSDLVYAYSIYGKVLAEIDKYDEAIDYFLRAYNVTPNASSMQNLGMIYSEKALYEAKKGYLAKAESDYSKAREYAGQAEIAAKNLGILLYNDGIAEYKSGREDIAILCLKESALCFKEYRTFELLGDLYYKRAELRKARFYWHRAKMLNPENAALTAKLNKIGKEISLAAREKDARIPHFEIRYKKNLPIDRQLASEILEKAYTDVGKDLVYFPKERTKVFFYSKEDFRNIFNMPYFVKAFYDGSIKMPSPQTRLDRERLERYIYHEYTHAIVSAKTNNNCPPWLSEGIALWEEYKEQRNFMENFLAKLKREPDISFKFLDESFKTDEITKDRALCYILSYTLVSYILDNKGLAGLQGILNRLSNKQHIVNAIDDEFLLSEKEFEKRWRKYVLDKYFK